MLLDFYVDRLVLSDTMGLREWITDVVEDLRGDGLEEDGGLGGVAAYECLDAVCGRASSFRLMVYDEYLTLSKRGFTYSDLRISFRI